MKQSHVRLFAASAALVVVLAVAGGAVAQGMHHHGGMDGDFGFGLSYFTDVLDLTQAQQDQMKAIMEKEKPAIHPLMQQMMQFHKDMSALNASGTFDEAKVRALAAQNTQTMTELMVQKARIQSEMMAVLTADQKTKLAAIHAKHEARMQEHMAKHAQDPTSN